MATPLAFRLRIRNQSTLAAPDGTADDLVISSVAGVGSPYIAGEPVGDGSEIDPLSGRATVGRFRVTAIDAPASGPGVIPGAGVTPAGIITSWLNAAGDTPGANSSLSRRAYLEVSTDGGVTWPTTWVAGYTNRVQLLDGATFEFTIGETLRLHTAMTVFKTIVPGLDRGTCVLGGPIGGTPDPVGVPVLGTFYPVPQHWAIPAPPWNNSTSYVAGNVVIIPSTQITYIATAGNTNDMPPDVAHWTAVPAGLTPAGVYVSTTAYAVAAVVVDKGAAYVAIQPTTGHEPPNTTYWAPLTATLLPSWGIVNDYGGVDYLIDTLGTSTQSFSMTLMAGWFKVPVKKPGAPSWAYRVRGNIPDDFSSANALIPQLCSQFGPSPSGYGGTFLNPNRSTWRPGGVTVAAPGGTVDNNPALGTPDGSGHGILGWVIGGIVLQCTLADGRCVSVNAYPQMTDTVYAKGARYSLSPVLIHPKSRTTWVDWHDFYRRDVTTGAPIDPIDQNGNPVPYSALTTSTVLKVKAVVLPVQSTTPLHIAMHPIDLLCRLWANAGIAWDPISVGVQSPQGAYDVTVTYKQHQSITVLTGGNIAHYHALSAVPAGTAVTNATYWQPVSDQLVPTGGGIRAALGADLVLVARVTTPMTIANVFEQWIGGPLGIGLRINALGHYQLVDVRSIPNAVPTITWTDADIDDRDTSPIWDLDEQRTAQQVTYQYTTFIDWDSNINAARDLDDVIEVPNANTNIDSDFAVFGTQQITYTIPGAYAGLTLVQGITMVQFSQSKSMDIFERYGRSSAWCTATILGTSPQANLGDVVIFNSIRTPNPALNARGGPRLMTVLKKTLQPFGAQYVLEDLGVAGAVAPLVPTFTLSADPADPSHVVRVTVTNASALLAQYPHGRIEIGLTTYPGTPTGVISAGVFDLALTSSGVLTLPAVAMGSTVQVEARARPGSGQLASAWSAYQSITLSIPTSVTDLVWQDYGGGAGALTWTNTDTSTPIQVSMTDGLHPQLVPIEQMGPSSTFVEITGLTPATTYTATVAHLESAPSKGQTRPAQLTFTTGAGAGTCATPQDPIAYVLTGNHRATGFAVFNAELVPGTQIVVMVATETAYMSGIFGTPVEYARVPVMPNAWLVVPMSFPVNGLFLHITAHATRLGVTDSAATPIVTIMSGFASPPSDYPVAVPTCTLSEVDVSGGVAINVNYTPPTDVQFLQMNYGIEARPAGSSASYTTLASVPGTNTGDDFIPAQPGTQYRITPSTLTTGSPALLTQDEITVNPTVTVGAGIVITCPLHPADPTFTSPTADTTNVNYAWAYDNYTAYMEVFSETYASDPGTIGSVEGVPGSYVPPTLDLSKTNLQLGVTSGLPWRVTTFVAYDRLAQRGISTTFKTQRTGSSPTTAPTLTLVGTAYSGSVLIKATFVTTPTAGDMVYLYRDGVEVNSATVASGDVSNGYIEIGDASSVYPNTYSYTATQTTGGSTSAASSPLSVTMVGGGTIPTPANSTFTKRYTSHTQGAFTSYHGYITIIPHSGGGITPSGTLFTLQYSTNGGSTWTTVAGGGSPDGVGVEVDMGAPFASGGGPTVLMRTFGTYTGWTNSANSSNVTATPGVPW